MWILLGIFFLAGIAIWWWRSPYSNAVKEKISQKLTPTMEVAAANISELDKERVKIKSKIILSNSFPVEIKSKQLQYEVFIDSVKIIDDIYEEPFTIHSSDNTIIEVPMEILKEPLFNLLE